ncbi:hypothetical protein INT43_002276 [Umbelopsis isabellina]|uniref:Uncharacterized protein n=1 Tax=Mortierella isabellina TaxID=91625 RepID=A0A8H7Q694_MORIS|nr:hypothetical protein INT43_002276 [Umbelopsis isabellina]
MTGIAWSLACAVIFSLSAQQAIAQVQNPSTEYGNNGQQTGVPQVVGAGPTSVMTSPDFDSNDETATSDNQSWISSHYHWVIILVICLLVAGGLIYYCARSIIVTHKKMKKSQQDVMPLQYRQDYNAPPHVNESMYPPPMYSYEPPKYEQAGRY